MHLKYPVIIIYYNFVQRGGTVRRSPAGGCSERHTISLTTSVTESAHGWRIIDSRLREANVSRRATDDWGNCASFEQWQRGSRASVLTAFTIFCWLRVIWLMFPSWAPLMYINFHHWQSLCVCLKLIVVLVFYAPHLIGWVLSDAFVWRLSVWRLSRTSGLSREQRGLGRPKLA